MDDQNCGVLKEELKACGRSRDCKSSVKTKLFPCLEKSIEPIQVLGDKSFEAHLDTIIPIAKGLLKSNVNIIHPVKPYIDFLKSQASNSKPGFSKLMRELLFLETL